MKGEIDDATAMFREALQLFKQIGGDAHEKVPMCLVDLAKLYEEKVHLFWAFNLLSS